MKWIFLLLLTSSPFLNLFANEPDSTYIFAYSTGKQDNKAGLHFAWSRDQKTWHTIGPEFAFVKSDYGTWGGEKRMFDPVLTRGADGYWHAVWTVNDQDPTFAYAKSPDLVRWIPQEYPILHHHDNCTALEIEYDQTQDRYRISWIGNQTGEKKFFQTTTKDFRRYADVGRADADTRIGQRSQATIAGREETGTLHKVPWEVIDKLIKHVQVSKYRNAQHAELMRDDPTRFRDLHQLEANITVQANESKAISDKLIGIFFEDINYAADGGIYAELVQNRGFEYQPTDRKNDPNWHSKTAWKTTNRDVSFAIETASPIHENNKHYAVLTVNKVGAGLQNEGFDGISLKANAKYDFSVLAKTIDGKDARLKIRLLDEHGAVYGETITGALTENWKKQEAVLVAKGDVSNGRLEIIPQAEGKIALDMVSLFPQETFNERKNGLRRDLAQVLADIKPRFVRFPGGCVAHGQGIENIYHWKNTIGPLEARKPQRNLWGYHQSMGLGYYEYFQFCADIGAAPMPIVAAGVPCQNSEKCDHPIGGQQGGIPLEDMGAYIQDILDLIEWANGDPKTNKWAKMRAEAGHPEPFNLKYIGVGNEDLISEVFIERFQMIFDAIKEKYPDIVVIGTSGPWSEGSDYERGWEVATELGVPMIDEHYYQTPGWYIHNQDFYDRYDRSKAKVYVGEYAAHLPNRATNIETALTEALHLINIERNADIVSMTSYAPLLAKEKRTQWNPDLIYFNNDEIKPTVGYYVQKLFGVHAGNEYFANHIELNHTDEAVRKRVACSVVKDEESGDIIIRLANLLPVGVRSKVTLDGLLTETARATKMVLSGRPDDDKAQPVTAEITVEKDWVYEIPPYSFTVVRVANPK
ncbi:alpha-L-arabinofuranosidase C-terminal domain-containing protein [Sphingobacterium arenae]|uniref:non-reducing end alpha-L-arabinofuranosidase n=1 Tax=Sphingobacterium arenae TaxID=1280598 RepID=A0ABR7Y2A6_9SPHI|nr:alpha-L-arabinofuranosidase C-terminal domain-containing protein [Sphingobacterium arenae]MBD1425440.1 carbohydrate binding domain-containing protein [Sphingobacterium arenae]